MISKDKSRNDIITNQPTIQKDKLRSKITFHSSTSSSDFPICTSAWQMTLSPELYWLQADYSLMRNTQLQNTITRCRHVYQGFVYNTFGGGSLPSKNDDQETFQSIKSNIFWLILQSDLANNNKIQTCWRPNYIAISKQST